MAVRERKGSHALHCSVGYITRTTGNNVCLALTRDELDLVLLGQIMALLSNDTGTGPKSSKKPSPRQRSAMLFHHGGWRICGKTFQKLHGIGMIATTIKGVGACEYHNVIIIILISGKDRFMAVKAHFLAAGLTTRVHKRTKCLPHNACSIFR